MTDQLPPEMAAAWKAQTYVEKLPEDIGPFRNLLETYSKIPSAEVDDHLYKIVRFPFTKNPGRSTNK